MSKPALPESQAAQAKDKCRVTNWPDYERALVRRGDVTVWFDEDFLRQHWHGKATGKRGMPLKHSDAAIQTLLMLKAVFGLPYRSVEGLARSLMRWLGLAFPGPVHRVVDSTGLKVYGEGKWNVRQHGVGKRRTWRKVHLAVDGTAKGVVGVEVTTVAWSDGEVFEGLVEQVEGTIEQIDGDGAYDTRNAYDVAATRKCHPLGRRSSAD